MRFCAHLAEQEPHDLEVAPAPGVHHHLEQRQGGDLDVLEEVRVLVPRLGRQQALLLLPVVLVNLVPGANLEKCFIKYKQALRSSFELLRKDS